MINPDDPLDIQVQKQGRIIDALIRRADRAPEVRGSAYSLFQSAVALQGEVWAKTKDLERALDTLGQASNQLQVAEFAREQTQKNLGDALEAMEGGFALFTDNKLQVCNDLFRNLLADVSEIIQPGLDFREYFQAVQASAHVRREHERDQMAMLHTHLDRSSGMSASFVLALKDDRWFQITHQRTSSDNIVVLQTDITGVVRRNQTEQNRLIDAQAHFLQAAFDHMSSGICTFSHDGHLLINNARFGELLGLPFPLLREGTSFGQILEFVRKNRLIYSPNETLDFKRMLDQLSRDGSLQERIRHIEGTILDFYAHVLPNGGFIVNIMDVTVEFLTTEALERRVDERTVELTQANRRLREQYENQALVEEALRLAKEEAEGAVSSKTRFLAAASHDLLQPINAAKLFISTLTEQSRETSMADTVDRLVRSFNSIEQLLHALLDISRLDSTGTELRITEFPINDILLSARDEYSSLAAEKDLQLTIVPSGLWVRSDQRYLSRSVQNLIVNAIQYTETGRVLVGCRRHGSEVVLEVWDTGVGISKKDQERVFEEFTRMDTKRSETGMGLGLSIVQRACQHLGHQVNLRSKPGVGSVFSITMPMTEAKAPPPRTSLPTAPVQDSEMDLIVVIIENDPDVLFATTQKLESWGASVLGAESTEDALALVQDIGMAPDIILADYQLNGDDNGVKAIQALRKATGSVIPAIMITADRSESLIQISHQNRFTVLTKPVQLSRLRPLIDWKTRVRAN